jgi:hypothetical protein
VSLHGLGERSGVSAVRRRRLRESGARSAPRGDSSSRDPSNEVERYTNRIDLIRVKV